MRRLMIYSGDKCKNGNYVVTGITDLGEVIVRMLFKNPENAKKVLTGNTPEKIKLDAFFGGEQEYECEFIDINQYKHDMSLLRSSPHLLADSPRLQSSQRLKEAFDINAREGKKAWQERTGEVYDHEKDIIQQ
jgi:hypothetical protein